MVSIAIDFQLLFNYLDFDTAVSSIYTKRF